MGWGERLGAKQPGLGSRSDLAVSCATSPLLDTWRVSTGHQRSVETVSFSHDSKQLASGGWDKRVMLWEVQVCGGAAREAWDPERPSTRLPFPNRKRLFHLTARAHTWCSTSLHLAAATSPGPLPPTLVSQLLCHEVLPLLSRPWKPPQPLRSMTLPRLAEGPGSDPSEVELSKAQGSLLQSGQVLRHFVGHRDSVQSSDFAPSSDCLVSHLCPRPKRRQLGAHPHFHFPTWARVVKIPHLDLALLSLSPL